MSVLDLTGRVYLLIGLSLAVCVSSALGKTADKISLGLPSLPAAGTHFMAPELLWPAPVLSAVSANPRQGIASVLSQFYPLLQSTSSSQDFEQVQSIIIPGGILDTINKVVYLENGSNNIIKLDLSSGKTIRQINNVCSPIAVINNCLLALSKTSNEAKSSYDLIMLGGTKVLGYKARWSSILLPEWLDLPTDGERQKFVFNTHCYNWTLSVPWQANKKMMFPNALSWLAPYMSQPSALQGRFSCDLKSQTIVSQSMEQSNDDFLAYLTSEAHNLPAQVILNADNIAIKPYDSYLFSLIRSYPPEHNISKGGVVGQRELQVTDMNTGKILWTHTLPATFIPLSF